MDLMTLFSADSAMGKMMAKPIEQMEQIMKTIADHMHRGNQINDQLLAEIVDLRKTVDMNNTLLCELLMEEKHHGKTGTDN